MLNNKKIHLVSLGCTKNLVDSEVMLGKLREYKITDNPEDADIIIVNTCGFIDAAKSESINTILSLHDVRKKDSLLVMSGCLSERYKQELQREMSEVDIFTGVGDYENIDTLVREKQSKFSDEVYLIDENSARVITGSSTHAYVKISEGCNQACSFCAIPSFKGKLHSRTLSSIVKEVTRLVGEGFYEFTFVSQDSSSYGRDMGLKDGLIDLIKVIEKVEGVEVARILYLYPSTTTYALIDALSSSSVFLPYFDMPIQHIDDVVLKTMKRGFGEQKTKELLEYMRSKEGSFVRTSIIAGHPNESDEAFEKVCEFIEDFGFDRINIFEYSNEENTTAHEMEQIDEEIISERADILGEIADEQRIASLEKMVGKSLKVIIEGESDEHEYLLSARPILWAKDIDGDILINDTNEKELSIGKIYDAYITELLGDRLIAKIVLD
ncbi:MAG: ribosomal protein S12 methylthiotransferase [Sulfurovum sp. AS07-7]|nr:MAG: ribosomal protein S12 methylthiotransferase [Sulfurovum sp. AS07-7]